MRPFLAGSLPVTVIHHLHRTTTPAPRREYSIVIGSRSCCSCLRICSESYRGKGVPPREEIPFRKKSNSFFPSLFLSRDHRILLLTRPRRLRFRQLEAFPVFRQRFLTICVVRDREFKDLDLSFLVFFSFRLSP